MVEKRDKPRQKSLLRGYVYFDGSPCAVACIVREISKAGARLQFETPPLAAESCELGIPARGQKLRAEVKWQQDDEIGVLFAGASDTSVAQSAGAPAPPALDEDLAMRVLRLEGEVADLRHLVKRLQQKLAGKIEAA